MREPIPKPVKLTKQGVPDLGAPKSFRERQQRKGWGKASKAHLPALEARWKALRAEYMAEVVNDEGYWECSTKHGHGCGRWLTKPEVTVDHIIKRSVAPDRVFDKTNLQILCWNPCHLKKDGGMRFK